MDVATWVAAVFGLATFGIAFLQLQLMQRQREIMDNQTDLMNRQLEIAARQDEIVLVQLAAVPDLRVRFSVDPDRTLSNGIFFVVNVENIGTSSAAGFTWQIGVQQRPGPAPVALLFSPGGNVARLPEVADVIDPPAWLWRGRVDSRLYKRRQVTICHLRIEEVGPGQRVTFLSQVAWDDAEFPPEGGYHVQVAEIEPRA